MDNFSYDRDSLKVKQEEVAKSATKTKEIQNLYDEKEKELSNKEAALIILMIIAMYVAVSAIPTFVMMYFFNISFLLSQLIVIIGSVVVIWVFGLYKPASDELKAKSRFFH